LTRAQRLAPPRLPTHLPTCSPSEPSLFRTSCSRCTSRCSLLPLPASPHQPSSVLLSALSHRRTSCSRRTSRWSCSWGASTAAARCTKSTSSGRPPTRVLGAGARDR
jgi:hypothetical protein